MTDNHQTDLDHQEFRMNTTTLARGTGLAVAGVALAASLTACTGGESDQIAPSPTQSATASGTATTAPTPSTTTTTSLTTATGVPAQVKDAFPGGNAPSWKDGVAAAYNALDVALGVQTTLVAGAHPARDYEAVRPLLTPERWKDLAKAADAGDPDDVAGGLVPTVATGPNAGTLVVDGDRRVAPTGLAGAPRFGNAAVGVRSDATNTALAVRVPVTAEYRTANGSATRTTTVTLAMVPVGSGWLVNGWQTDLRG